MRPILPTFHFVFSGRYWFHIQDFQEFVTWVVGYVRHPSSKKNKQNENEFHAFDIYENTILGKWIGMCSCMVKYFCNK